MARKDKDSRKLFLNMFLTEAELPSVIFYDNNCNLRRHILTSPEDSAFFCNVLMPVDVFHFKSKHSVKDVFCQQHCNPALWPQLRDGDKWVFNSSIAEQTNVWLGGYHAMLREMNVDSYEFFLDEMIHRRNNIIIAKLEKNGHAPFAGAFM